MKFPKQSGKTDAAAAPKQSEQPARVSGENAMQTTSQPAFILDEPSYWETVARAAGNFTLPIAILGASFLIVSYVPDPPDFFTVLKLYAPYFTLGVGLLVALAFKRGRALFAVL